jgi:putative spermidine/putrescine transport system ATP-binding protein
MDATAFDSTQTIDAPRAPSVPGAGAGVVLESIAKHYGPHKAIDDLHLDIRPGEFITLLGPSGSGKTTTLMLIAGFVRPTAGEILIDGKPVARLPPYRRNIGMVFQSYALFPHLTVAENVAFPLKQRGVGRAERQEAVLRMLDMVQLRGLEARFPQQLSGGQQQRVAIARAIVFNPRVLLMDEPLSALDKQLRETLQLEIKRLHDRLGITFVYVTHDQREALVMSDRVSVMNNGRIEQIATPQVLYDAPTNRFVAAFVGEANFATVAGLSAATAGTLVADTGWGTQIRVPADQGAGSVDCACMVRPEKMTAVPMGTNVAGHNAIHATVREVVFMGDTTRYALETGTGETVLVKQQNRAATPLLAVAEPALVTWAIEDTRLVT